MRASILWTIALLCIQIPNLAFATAANSQTNPWEGHRALPAIADQLDILLWERAQNGVPPIREDRLPVPGQIVAFRSESGEQIQARLCTRLIPAGGRTSFASVAINEDGTLGKESIEPLRSVRTMEAKIRKFVPGRRVFAVDDHGNHFAAVIKILFRGENCRPKKVALLREESYGEGQKPRFFIWPISKLVLAPEPALQVRSSAKRQALPIPRPRVEGVVATAVALSTAERPPPSAPEM